MPDAVADPRPRGVLDEHLERYLRHVAIERGLSAHTVAAYRRDLIRFLDDRAAQGGEQSGEPGDQGEPGGAITSSEVTRFVRGLRDREAPLAPASVSRMLSSVRGFTRFLVDEGVLASDPAAEVSPPKAAQRLPKALSVAEVERLLAATEGDEPARLRDRALLELLYATGARISEAVALNVDDLLGESGTAELVRVLGKGGKQRIVPVGRYARAALDAYLVRGRPLLSARGDATPALFIGARGARVSRQSAWLIIRAAAERAELTAAISPHSLRHSFATHLLQGGADVRVVQELLGHANVATTQIYTHVTADALRDAYTAAHPRSR